MGKSRLTDAPASNGGERLCGTGLIAAKPYRGHSNTLYRHDPPIWGHSRARGNPGTRYHDARKTLSYRSSLCADTPRRTENDRRQSVQSACIRVLLLLHCTLSAIAPSREGRVPPRPLVLRPPHQWTTPLRTCGSPSLPHHIVIPALGTVTTVPSGVIPAQAGIQGSVTTTTGRGKRPSIRTGCGRGTRTTSGDG